MKSFFNKLLYINLSDETFEYKDISDEILKKTLGGKGLGTYLLHKENLKGVDPLSEDNVFIISTGPVTGTKMWSQSRFGVYTKSPATSGFGESYCGGSLAPRIKGCGIDAIVIKGKSSSLKYLHVDENGVKFHSADKIKGFETDKAESFILENAPENSRAMVIGPAGENLVKLACIKSDRWRSLGRGGLGTVLGSKNIKGISFSGQKRCEVADENLLKQVIKKVSQIAKDSPVTPLYQTKGTPMQVMVTNSQNCFPTRYWKKGHFSKHEQISAEYMQKELDVRKCGCPTCFLQCTKLSKLKKGRHSGLEIEGPEYETIYAIGGLNEIDSLEEICHLNDVFDRLGLDTMSAGNISAFAVEAFNAGKSDYEIKYNDPDAVSKLYHMVAHREGVGDILANGIKEASQSLGLEDIAIHVKGLEPAGFDPRVLKGMGLSYATSARGACHLRGTFYKAELSGQIEKNQIEGKAKLHIDYEDRAAIFDSLVLCRFFRDFILWDELLSLVEATTGMKLTKDELADIANDITNSTREYNLREGIDSSFDTLPKRFLHEPTEEGAAITEDELKTMISEYNSIRKREV